MSGSVTKPSIAEEQPLWVPPPGAHTRLHEFMDFAGQHAGRRFTDYEGLQGWSVEAPEAFWGLVWDFTGLIGDRGAETIRKTPEVPWARFFPDSRVSYAENILAQAARTPEGPAIIARTQGGSDRILSWRELSEQVSLWEQALAGAGVREGDKVGVYLPNIPESVIVLLAASNLGAVFSSAGMEMGGDDLITRFSQVRPRILITADGYIHGAKQIGRLEVVARAQAEVPGIEKTVIIPVLEGVKPDLSKLSNSLLSHDFIGQYRPKPLQFNRRDFNYPLYILFSSGTTGKPKCFEHSTGGILLKHLCEQQLNSDIHPGDRVFYHATPSWMMWNWLVSALSSGATILMYDGSPAYPDASAQWNFTSVQGCTHHGTAAPVILSWGPAGVKPGRDYDLSPLRMVLSTGAVLPAQGFEYVHEYVKKNVKISSISGGTDIVGCFLGGNPLMPTYAGQVNGPMLGMDVRVWNEQGEELPAGEAGELVCANPFPSMPLRFLDDPDGHRYKDEYFSFYTNQTVWKHGDSIMKTKQGQLVIIGRSDATLNQNGVRIGAGAIYKQLEPLAGRIEEAAAVDFTRPDNKQAITILFLVLKGGGDAVPEDLAAAIRKNVKDNVTPYAIPTEIMAVPGVLKTPNGKKAEVVMKKALAGKDIPNPSLYGADLVKLYQATGRDLARKYGGGG